MHAVQCSQSEMWQLAGKYISELSRASEPYSIQHLFIYIYIYSSIDSLCEEHADQANLSCVAFDIS